MYNATVPPLGQPELELRVARAIHAKAPDADHGATPARLPSLQEYHDRIHGTIAERRSQLERHASVRARAETLAALARGEKPPKPELPTREIALILLKTHSNPSGAKVIL